MLKKEQICVAYFKMNHTLSLSLREKCPYSEFFWSVFPTFGLNADRKNSEYGHFSMQCIMNPFFVTRNKYK